MGCFSKYDIGGCGCGTPAFNVTVDTRWCGMPCPAPGTVTVAARSGACPGGVVAATATADPATGLARSSLPPGTYGFSAATTAGGFLNGPVTGPAPSALLYSPLYPAVLHVSDGRTGLSGPVYPYGALPPGAGYPPGATGDPNNYISPGPLSYAFGGGCPDNYGHAECPAADVPIWYLYQCAGSPGAGGLPGALLSAFFGLVDATSPLPAFCPGGSGARTSTAATLLLGTGPGPGNPCGWPLNQEGTYHLEYPAGIPITDPCIYADGDPFTVTQ
jgi:hypothetical protein